MVSVEEARTLVLEGVLPLPSERVSLADALGRVLAEDAVSDVDVAPFDNSAMDGYALQAADTEGASAESPVVLRVIDHIAAGTVSAETIVQGTASRIMTGAPVPAGADAVVMVEMTEGRECGGSTGGTVAVMRAAREGQNIRRAGEEVMAGALVLAAGERIGPAAIGVLASTGNASVSVYRRPRVAVLSTGDELVPVTEKPGPGKIRNSNLHSLSAQIVAAGGIPVPIGVVLDTREGIRDAILEATGQADVVISSGGVSVGDFDYVTDTIAEIGDLKFDKVGMRPGASQTYGRIGAVPYFGLPGNPTAAYVGFEMIVRPLLRALQGMTDLERPVVRAVLAESHAKKAGRRQYVRTRLERLSTARADGVLYSAMLSGSQSSALLGTMHRATCLAVLPEGETDFPAGTVVDCVRLDVDESVVL